MTSKLLLRLPKHKRVLKKVIEDGSARTFVYESLEEETKPTSNPLVRWLKARRKRHQTRNKRR